MSIANIKKKDLIFDDKNFNKGSENGSELIKKSFSKFGSGRSILIDKNNRIIAGNKSVEFSDMQEVQVVESDGTKLIAVKRIDIDLDSPIGREMALADNASAKANIVFDAELIEAELGEAVVEEWGVELIGGNLDGNFNTKDEYNYQNKVTIEFKTFEEANSYFEKSIKENLKARLS